MYNFLLINQTVSSIFLIVLILLQASEGGAGGLWGASGGETYHTRRGVEKVIYYFTIFILLVFVINSIALLLV